MGLRLIGTGSALPEARVTNFDFEKMIDTSDEWIRTRTGIAERRICRGGENAETLGAEAARQALAMAGVSAADLKMIICTAVAPHTIVPSMACRIMGAIGAQCPSFDMNAECSGFIYAMSVASAVNDGPVLIVGAEQLSRFMDYTDRRVCVLFGDAAAATVFIPGDNLLHIETRAVPDTGVALYAPGVNHRDAGGNLTPSYMTMDGQEVFKFATREMMSLLTSTFEKTGLGSDDFACVIPHQANLRIIKSCSERLSIPWDKFCVNIDRFGNTSSASIPLALDERLREGKLALGSGERVLFAAFGAGWTSGAAALTL